MRCTWRAYLTRSAEVIGPGAVTVQRDDAGSMGRKRRVLANARQSISAENPIRIPNESGVMGLSLRDSVPLADCDAMARRACLRFVMAVVPFAGEGAGRNIAARHRAGTCRRAIFRQWLRLSIPEFNGSVTIWLVRTGSDGTANSTPQAGDVATAATRAARTSGGLLRGRPRPEKPISRPKP